MGKPILYFDNISPPVRSVLMLIEALKIDVEFKRINVFLGEHLAEEYLKICPVHTIPSLVHDDIKLLDSHAILIYLCEKYDKNYVLYSKDEKTRIKIIEMLFFNGTNLFRRDSDVFSHIIRDKPTEINKHLAKLEEAYNFLEIFLSESKYMVGNRLTIADLSILATFSTVTILLPVDGSNKWPRLTEWYNEMQKLPYYEKNLIGLNKLRDVLKDYVKFKIY